MNQITKIQHFVSSFYIKLWAKGNSDQVCCYDLKEQKVFSPNADAILARNYFYEEVKDVTDNRVEKILADMEGECSPVFQDLNEINLSSQQMESEIINVLDDNGIQKIRKFASYQYIRVPGAIDQKSFELSPSILSKEEQERALNPAIFVEEGYSYIEKAFQQLKTLIVIADGQDFVTSDWPCFDIKDSDKAPLLAVEIGRNPQVTAYMPLGPKIGAYFYHKDQSPHDGSRTAPMVKIIKATEGEVKNLNTMVIHQAERFIVSSGEKGFIFRVAKKRKK